MTLTLRGTLPGQNQYSISALDAICFIAIIFGLYSSLNMTTALFGPDADDVHGLLMWYGIKAHGLGWLKSWRFTPDNWLLSIVPIHFLVYSLFGPKLSFTIFLGWAIFVASAFATVAIAAQLGARKALAPIAAALLNLGPFAFTRGLAAYGTAHNTSNLYGLLTFLCLALWLTRRNAFLLLVSAVLLTSAAISDPWIVGAYGLPYALACLGLSFHPEFKPQRAQILVALLTVIGSLFLYYTQIFGLFRFIPKLSFSLASWNLMNENAIWVVKDLGGLMPIVPAVDSNYFILDIVSLLAFFFVFRLLVSKARESQVRLGLNKAFFYSVAALSVTGGTVALVIMSRPAADSSARFLLNDLYLGVLALGVLAENHWGVLATAEKLSCAILTSAFVLSGTISDATYLKRSGIAIKDTGITDEAAFLKANGLSYGYGPYWGANANAVTVLTKDQIRVRPVTFSTDTGMMIVRTRPQTSMEWFDPADAPPGTREWFAIVQSDGEECPDVQLCLTGLSKQFGPPVRTLSHGSQTIMVWDHPLVDYEGPPIPATLDQTIAFSKAGAFPGTHGWWMPESWGTWTNSKLAIVRLRLDKPVQGEIGIKVQGHAFVGGTLASQTVQVSVNHHPIGTLRYNLQHNEDIYVLRAPASVVGPDGLMEIEFLTDKPTSPAEAGVSIDNRKLCLGVEFLTVVR